VPTMLGVDQRAVAEKIRRLVPGYMQMGENGMHEMAEMEMPLPPLKYTLTNGMG